MEQPPLDILKERAYPELAAAVRASSERIVLRWRNEIVRFLPHADELTLKQLKNSVPDLLREMSDALAATKSAPVDKFVDDAPTHGQMRYHHQFSLNELLIEYHLLRCAIIDEVVTHLGRMLTASECIALNIGIDVAQRQAAVAFTSYQAQELTSEAKRMATYLSFLSHELRGGLNGSILMIEVLKRDLANEPKFAESLADLDMMRRSMLDTVMTMDRFLHAERLRRGKMPVKITEVDLNMLLGQLVRNAHHQISDHTIIVELKITAPPIVRTDPELVTMILQNLLSNAVKYSDGKPVAILVAALNGGQTRISVIDRGRGISPEKIATLFAPFERGDTYGQQGTGLGLAIARQAAELLGAKLHAESKVGNGTSFHLDLRG